MRVNTALLRRRLRDPNLKIKQIKVGVRTRTDIAIAYMDNIVDKNVLEQVENRLESINIGAVLESGYLEEFIEDSGIRPFPRYRTPRGRTGLPLRFWREGWL